jgi:hypothetical protein
MSTDEYENAKIKFFNNFSSVNISDIEQKTRGKNSNSEWYRGLTANKFGKIYKMRFRPPNLGNIALPYT